MKLRNSKVLVAAVTLWLASGMASYACDFPVPLISVERPTVYGADGSFEHAGIDMFFADNHFSVFGRAVIDVGNGRIAQRIGYHTGPCWGGEYLLFAECGLAQVVMVHGVRPDGGYGGVPYPSIALIQPPHGPIEITASATVDDVVRTAREAGLQVVSDFDAFMADWPRRSRFDPLRGCQIFYPELGG